MQQNTAKNGCILIPAYNEEPRIAQVIQSVKPHCPNIVVVDDGSQDDTARVAEVAGATVLIQPENRGKGAALERGFQYAREKRFDFVITMDGDGQHPAEDIPGFIKAYAAGEAPVIIGNRMDNPVSMPFVRRLTNRFMSWLLSRKLGQQVPDTQNGFRLYKTDIIPALPIEASRFAAESEILLELANRGIKIGSAPVQVIYRDEKSKINPIKDTWRFFKMLRNWKTSSDKQDNIGKIQP